MYEHTPFLDSPSKYTQGRIKAKGTGSWGDSQETTCNSLKSIMSSENEYIPMTSGASHSLLLVLIVEFQKSCCCIIYFSHLLTYSLNHFFLFWPCLTFFSSLVHVFLKFLLFHCTEQWIIFVPHLIIAGLWSLYITNLFIEGLYYNMWFPTWEFFLEKCVFTE